MVDKSKHVAMTTEAYENLKVLAELLTGSSRGGTVALELLLVDNIDQVFDLLAPHAETARERFAVRYSNVANRKAVAQ